MSVTGEHVAEPRTPLRERVRQELQARIADGRLLPGDRIFEQDLAVELGISRVPVREAIRMLQSEGFVDVPPGRRGVFVRGLDRQQAKELFEVREALEVYAARLAAERAEPGDVVLLAELAERGRKAHEAGAIDEMSDANGAFHDKLVELSGNELLASMLEPLHGRLAWLFRMNLEPERVCREHEAIQAAITAGDADRAAEVAKQHVLSSRRMVLERMLT
ncbi:transcriptional regulator, GntR family [Saccharopolyspora kobensis]|uniref:Transcriptional regulator, GntR family n=1 Tax=Saccharopolyspora kobensis TaxID=146035 RepID=A0A1H5UG86_9PSEU|nr:GntR family transcriptional regulator [Saccharopolyspora kobensis]SEF74019.1 transcriptional regulator, GntR family [Saccharopolyspora kobensis]SFC73758.1 transcriptional regulator, GntR family [Saccharopolyspora kobensis]